MCSFCLRCSGVCALLLLRFVCYQLYRWAIERSCNGLAFSSALLLLYVYIARRLFSTGADALLLHRLFVRDRSAHRARSNTGPADVKRKPPTGKSGKRYPQKKTACSLVAFVVRLDRVLQEARRARAGNETTFKTNNISLLWLTCGTV